MSTAVDDGPESSAARIALWRALHVRVDAPPHLIDDEIGLALVAPDDGWEQRPDMHPQGTAPYRIGVVARTRLVEDLLTEAGIGQYVLLGAGLDTCIQRHPELAGRVQVFEVDQAGPQAWKRRRLDEIGLGVPDHLHLVGVDFERDGDWWARLLDAGFDPDAPAIVSSSGVSMYLTAEANDATLRQLARLAPGSTVAMSFLVPFDLVDPAERPGMEGAARGAEASGTPWLSFYRPEEMIALALDAGFVDATTRSTVDIAARLRPEGPAASTGEHLLLART